MQLVGLRCCPPRGSVPSSRTLHRADTRSFEWVVETLLCFTSPFASPSPPPNRPREPVGCLYRDAKERPSAVRYRRVHSRARISAPASGSAEPPPFLVPSSRFSSALTAFASSILRVCCNALPAMGFTVFPRLARPLPHRVSSALRSLLPAPSGPPGFHRVGGRTSPAEAVHRAPCLPILPHRHLPHRCDACRRRGPQGLPPRPGSWRHPPFPEDDARYSPGLADPPAKRTLSGHSP